MLTQTAFQPLYGRLSDLIGRKVRHTTEGPPSYAYSFQSIAAGTIWKYAHLCGWIYALRSSQCKDPTLHFTCSGLTEL